MKIFNTTVLAALAISIMLSLNSANAYTTMNEARQKEVMQTGFRILNSNKTDKRITFYYKDTDKIKSRSLSRTKRVIIHSGLTPFIDDENELAGIISRQIARELDNHKGLSRRTARAIIPGSYEKKADLYAVDLMVNAGYDPVALITLMNKVLSEPNWFDVFGGQKGSKRLVNIYGYLYDKYPEYLVKNDYMNNIYYQNFLITTKKERSELKKEIDKKNVVPVNNKSPKAKKPKSTKKQKPQAEQI